MTRVAISVIVPTLGGPERRASLARALASISSQLEPGDEIIVLCNDAGDWGSSARNRGIRKATGTHLMFLDDDDEFAPRALSAAREFAAEYPARIGLFRMRFLYGLYGTIMWRDQTFKRGNVGTPMMVVPNDPDKLGQWDPSKYEADWCFIRDTVALQGEPIFRDEVIALIRPDRGNPIAVKLRYLRRRWRHRTRLRLRPQEVYVHRADAEQDPPNPG